MKNAFVALLFLCVSFSRVGNAQTFGTQVPNLQISAPRQFIGRDLILEKRFLDKSSFKSRRNLKAEEMEAVRREVKQLNESPSKRSLHGGGSSNGGGGGVRFEITQGLKVIVTNDYWETPVYGPLAPAFPEESALAYLHRVLESHIKPLDSYFYNRLLEAIGDVLAAPWIPRESLPLLSDLGNLRIPLAENHEAVQIAIRYSLSTPGYRPEIFIDYDPNLLDQLNTENLALLILHEAIYMWGTELRHEDSAKVRALAVRLLSSRGFPKIRVGKLELTRDQSPRILFQMEIRKLGFQNFVELYEKELRPQSGDDLSAHRRLVYSSFIRKSNGQSGGLQAFTDEEAFYYLYQLSSGFLDNDVKRLEEFIESTDPDTKTTKSVCVLGREILTGKFPSTILKMAIEPYSDRILSYCSSSNSN